MSTTFIALYTAAFMSTSLLFLAPLLVTLALKVNALVGTDQAPKSLALVAGTGDGEASAADRGGPAGGGLVEPLSERELDVLRLLTTDLDGPDIARQLHVSLSTVRSHTKSIYAKLGVGSRRAAVRQAADLGLLKGHGRG